MIINLIPDDSVASAPAGFKEAIEAAASILEQAITNDIAVNIAYGWGTYNNAPDANLVGANGAEGGYANGILTSFGTVKRWLAASATSLDDLNAIASLPATSAGLPNPADAIIVASAELKALGHYSGSPDALDGAIGFGTASTADFWLGAALHEITHAMGRISGYGGANFADLLDLFRYSGPGVFQWAGGQPAFFSIDGGTTPLVNFSTVSDYADLSNDSLSPNDSFDAFVTGSSLTSIDATIMDVMGFNVGNPLIVSSGQIQTVSAARLSDGVVRSGGTLAIASGAYTAGTTVDDGGIESVSAGGRASGTVVSSGGEQNVAGVAVASQVQGGGTVTVSSGGQSFKAVVSSGGEIVYAGGTILGSTVSSGGMIGIASGTTASSLRIGSGTTLIVSSGATADIVVLNGGTAVALAGADIAGRVRFNGDATFSITTASHVTAGLTNFDETDTLDVANIGFSGTEQVSFVEAANNKHGTLTIRDGALSVRVTLFGQYSAAGFHFADDGAVGTAVTYSPPATPHLDIAQHATPATVT